MKQPRRISEANYGLFHGPMRIEVEEATSRMSKACEHCGEVPEGHRLKVGIGTGRGASVEVYCSSCGNEWLNDHEEELVRARQRLRGEDVCIRMRR